MDISGVALMQSGNPLSVNSANDNLGFGGGTTNHADKIGNVTYPHTFNQWFSPNAFAQPAPLTCGNSPKNIVKGPGRDNWNLSSVPSGLVVLPMQPRTDVLG